MADTKDYRNRDGPGTMCKKYYTVGNSIRPRKDTLECEFEKLDRYHKYVCKFFMHECGMCRYGNE